MNQTLIYNFLDHKEDYVAKCLPYIEHMKTIGLLQDLILVQDEHYIKTFRKNWDLLDSDFNIYDVKLLLGTIPLLKKLINNTSSTLTELINLPDEHMIYLTKIIAKKYILYREHNVKNLKVMCNINVVDENGFIKSNVLVNCYHSRNDKGFICRPIKGSVSVFSKDTINAISKELIEEFDYVIEPNRLI